MRGWKRERGERIIVFRCRGDAEFNHRRCGALFAVIMEYAGRERENQFSV